MTAPQDTFLVHKNMAERQHGIELPSAVSGRLSGRELSEVCQRLLDAELRSGLVQGRDYTINLQRGKRPHQPDQDTAPEHLISSVSQGVLHNVSVFHALLDNYHRNTGVAETVTRQKEGEISDFLDGVMRSGPMQIAFDFLSSKNLVSRDQAQFKSQLYQMWFRLYTREVRDDTCGFEHVFVGESKNGEISGLHNWLQFFNLEQRRELDYRGYIFPKRMGGGDHSDVTPNDLIISVQFNVGGQIKDVSSIWLGTTPEFELALYTLCFVAGSEKNVIQLENQSGKYEVEIRCYHIRSKYGDKIGSAFPVLLAKHPSQQPGGGYQAQPAHMPYQQQQQYTPQQQHYPPQHPQGPPQQQPYLQPNQQQYQSQTQQQYSQQQGCVDVLVDIIRSIFGMNKSNK